MINGGAGTLANGIYDIFGGDPNHPYVKSLERYINNQRRADKFGSDPAVEASNPSVYITQYSDAARNDVQDWCTDTFAGKQDLNNKTIIDYMAGGALINATLPQATDFEQFYKQQMASRLIQALWQ